MLKRMKIAIPLIALAAMLMFLAPPQAQAKVHFGVYLGGPYAYPAYPYGYVAPYPYAYPPYAGPYPYGYGLGFGYGYGGYVGGHWEGHHWVGGHAVPQRSSRGGHDDHDHRR